MKFFTPFKKVVSHYSTEIRLDNLLKKSGIIEKNIEKSKKDYQENLNRKKKHIDSIAETIEKGDFPSVYIRLLIDNLISKKITEPARKKLLTAIKTQDTNDEHIKCCIQHLEKPLSPEENSIPKMKR